MGGGEERKGRRKAEDKGKPRFAVAPSEGEIKRRENSQDSLTPRSVEARKGGKPGSSVVSRDKKENERRAKKTLPSGITLQKEIWRNPVSTMDTSTQGGSSSSLTMVVPPVVTSETGDREFENRENNRHLKTGSFLSGEESQEILIQESIKRAMTPILKGLMTKFAKDGTIYKPDEVSQEVETDDQHIEKEKQEAKHLWRGGGGSPKMVFRSNHQVAAKNEQGGRGG